MFFLAAARLAQTADSVEGELLKLAKAGKLPERGRWNRLIEQLGDEQYARREAADRLLRQEGPAVASSLEQLDFDQLDAEQQFRVRRIVASFRGRIATDAPDQIAAMLFPEPLIWLAFLDRPEKTTRTAAAKQLAALLGEPIDVDPAADPATQGKQRGQLRTKIVGRRAAPKDAVWARGGRSGAPGDAR